MQCPVTLEEVTSAIRAFKAQVESSSQRLPQRKVCNYVQGVVTPYAPYLELRPGSQSVTVLKLPVTA